MTDRTGFGFVAVALCLAAISSSNVAAASEMRGRAHAVRDASTAPPRAAPNAPPNASGAADRIRMVLAAERAALETLSTDRAFAYAGGSPEAPDRIPAGRSSLAVEPPDLEALTAEDELAAALARGASDEMIEELLLGDVAAALDLGAIERLAAEADADGDSEWRCLAEAIYFEARGESLAGQVAVGEVVLNRVDAVQFPDTICDVVKEGADGDALHGCQFSYECDGVPEVVANREAFAKAGTIARLLMAGRPRVLTQSATFYHAITVEPRWARRMIRSARIGDHIFYRPPTRLSSN